MYRRSGLLVDSLRLFAVLMALIVAFGLGTDHFFGVLIIAVLDTGLAQIGAQEPVKRLVTGGVIILPVVLDNYRHRRGWRAP